MNRTLSPFPRMFIERYRLSVTLRVIVLFLARKYQQTLDTSLGTHPTVFPSTTTAAHDYAHFGSLLGDLHTVPVNSNDHSHQQSRTSRAASSTGRVQYRCDNVGMGAFSWQNAAMLQISAYPPCLGTK